MIDLETLVVPPPKETPVIAVGELVAAPGFAPNKWQSRCPDFARDGGNKIPVGASKDLDRVLVLPRRPQPEEGSAEADALIAFMTARYAKPNNACRCDELFRKYGMVDEDGNTPACITELRLIQAWALLEITTCSGMLGPIGVGHGKTILDLLAPLAMPNCKVAVLLVPPSLVKQLWRDYQIVGQHFQMPKIVFHDKAANSALAGFPAGTPVMHVYPYSMLQRPENTAYLEEQLRPDTIIADEVHKLKAADTATTGRVLRYFKANHETRFCGWSGSLTDKSITEYAHLAALALRWGSPLPINLETAKDWARAIDPPKPGGNVAPEGALIALCRDGEHIQSGFHRRLVETPGVVATKTAAVDAEIVIVERFPPEIPDSVAAALDTVRNEWIRPDGEELPDALARFRCAIEVSCGFFYRWRFPKIKGQPQSIATIIRWKNARADWNKEVRAAIRSRREHFDSEKLARNAAERAYGDRPIHDKKLPVWASVYYCAWKEIENAVVYETEPVWIDDWLARDAAAWAQNHRGIIWYWQAAFGDRIAEISGLNQHTGGPDAGELIAREDGKRSIIASIRSHGTGRDGLQYKYDDELVTSPPSRNEDWEQLLGRLHRVGQKSKRVSTAFYQHTPELARNVNQALVRSGYVQTTMGSAQKLKLSGLVGRDEEDEE